MTPNAVHDLRAILRARLAVSRTQRREEPGAWWMRRIALSLFGLSILGGSTVTAAGMANDPGIEPSRAAALIFLGPAGVAVIMLGMRMSTAARHPLGFARAAVPLGRWRSASLAIVEDLIAPEAAFLLVLGWLPWLAVRYEGGAWLSGSGWVVALLFPVAILFAQEVPVAVAARTLMATGQANRIARATGWALSVGLALGFIGLRSLGEGAVGPLVDIEILAWANTGPAPGAVALGLLGALMLSVSIRAAVLPKIGSGRTSMAAAAPVQTAPVAIAASTRTLALLLARRHLRQPVVRYASAVALGSMVVMALLDAFGGGLAGVLAVWLLAPYGDLFNLYGSDPRASGAWLASGRPLSHWAFARLAVVSTWAYLVTCSGLIFGVATSFISPGLAGAVAGGALGLVALGWLAGPAVSAVIAAPRSPEVSFRGGQRNSGSLWFGGLVMGASAGLTVGGSVVAYAVGWGFVPWVIVAVLGGFVAALRPWRRTWTPKLRERIGERFTI